MNCPEAQKVLSQFYDGELRDELHGHVAAHLESCAACIAQVAQLQALSNLVSQTGNPTSPEGLWQSIDSELNRAGNVVRTAPMTRSKRWLSPRTLVAAILVVLIGGIGFRFLLRHSDHEHQVLAVDFDHYLEAFAEDPERAAGDLFAKYPSEQVSLEAAASAVGYRPVIANSLPDGYSVDSIHLMNMPCCKCIKTICRDEEGKVFVVFEHDAKQAMWFGERKKQQCDCGGVPTTVIEFDSQIAATWPVGKRSVTIIGVQDVDEVARLMPFLGHDSNDG